MTWFRSRLRRELDGAKALIESLQKQAWTLSHAVLQERAEKALILEAKARAETDADYWKTRAERFLDQIGLRQGIISVPTMTEPAPARESTVDSIFGALGMEELPRDKSPVPAAARTAATVIGVDPAAATAAVNDALESV